MTKKTISSSTDSAGGTGSDTVQTVDIDVVSDVMCPWCYIGKRRLETALDRLGPDIEANIRWRPYQLDPTLPPEGKDRRAYLEQKFGGPERAKAIYAQIEQAGRDEDLAFQFQAITVSSNTLDAHRLIRWAANEGPQVQDALVERLFTLYFMDGGNLGDHEALIKAAEMAGMNGSIVAALLATDKDREDVEAEIEVARRMGVTGVPCFIIDNTFAVMGAQDADHLVGAIKHAAQQPKTKT